MDLFGWFPIFRRFIPIVGQMKGCICLRYLTKLLFQKQKKKNVTRLFPLCHPTMNTKSRTKLEYFSSYLSNVIRLKWLRRVFLVLFLREETDG